MELSSDQKNFIKKGIESMKREGAPKFVIDDYIYDMTIQFKEEKRPCQHQ
jgi:hypothetical protein